MTLSVCAVIYPLVQTTETRLADLLLFTALSVNRKQTSSSALGADGEQQAVWMQMRHDASWLTSC